MKILLQNRVTKEFWGEQGWTSDPNGAKDFPSSTSIIYLCMEQEFTDIIILLTFSCSELNLSLEPFGSPNSHPPGEEPTDSPRKGLG